MSRFTLFASLLFAMALAAEAQQLPGETEEERGLVHFSYANLLGTGVYTLDDRTVYIFRVPISWTAREPTTEKFGVKLLVPVAVGFHDFDFADDLVPTSDQLSTISVVPGLELQYLVGENWRVAPSGYLGLGIDATNRETSLIYGAGVSALRPLNFTYPDMNFGTALILSGYDPGNAQGDFVTRWSAGLDAKFPTSWSISDRDVFLGGHVIGYYYMNRLEFNTIIDEPIKLRAELEFGVFFGLRPTPKIFGIKVDRLGMGYRFSDVGDAIVFFAGFPF